MTNHSIRDGRRLLRQPDIRKLFVAYFISYTGTAMAFGVLEITDGAALGGLLVAAFCADITSMLDALSFWSIGNASGIVKTFPPNNT
ncbi:MAG: hypothetical protein MI976_05715 [Pseudomonadales bacterium]|nr:hypothetical protein [Pseudomonadales bacterium]